MSINLKTPYKQKTKWWENRKQPKSSSSRTPHVVPWLQHLCSVRCALLSYKRAELPTTVLSVATPLCVRYFLF